PPGDATHPAEARRTVTVKNASAGVPAWLDLASFRNRNQYDWSYNTTIAWGDGGQTTIPQTPTGNGYYGNYGYYGWDGYYGHGWGGGGPFGGDDPGRGTEGENLPAPPHPAAGRPG